MKKCAILGAGISGLAAAWFLKKAWGDQIEITLYEKSSRVGGWIHTLHTGGFLFEAGPRGFVPRKKGNLTLELVHELGLQNELIAANSHARKRYIYFNNKFHKLSLPFLLKQGLLTACLRDLMSPKTSQEDETIDAFFKRRFNYNLAENLIDPFCTGVLGGKSNQLSIKSCMPTLWKHEQTKGSVIKGIFFSRKGKKEKPSAPIYTFKEGMDTLPQKIAEKLEAQILLNHEVKSLSSLEADLIISALPTHALAQILEIEAPQEFATLSTVSFGWNEPVLKKKGYGFLIPSKEKTDVLGMTWDSKIHPTQNLPHQTRICVMIANPYSPQILYDQALKSIQTYLGIKQMPSAHAIHTSYQAIPQYTLQNEKRLQEFTRQLPPHLYATGNCYEGVGINDCITHAKSLVSRISL